MEYHLEDENEVKDKLCSGGIKDNEVFCAPIRDEESAKAGVSPIITYCGGEGLPTGWTSAERNHLLMSEKR